MNNIFKFNDVIAYIEENLDGNVVIEEMAKRTCLSVYEFRRVFAFVVGVPVSEYIRNRRLSVAAEDMLKGQANITELALKYGYENPASFSRAFKSFHGISPTEVLKGNQKIKIYTKVGLDFCVSGGAEIEYKIISDTDFYVVGYMENSNIEDAECCERVWQNFYEQDFVRNQKLSDKIYATYYNEANNVRCTIGQRNLEKSNVKGEYVPASLWACFSLKGTEDSFVNGFYNDILYKFFDTSAYRRADTSFPNLEIFPVDMDTGDFEWEIRIPVRLKETK